MDKADCYSNSGPLPKAGWEIFETKSTSGVNDETEKENAAEGKDFSRKKIASMFQASRPGTSASVKTERSAFPVSSSTRSLRTEPLTAIPIAPVGEDGEQSTAILSAIFSIEKTSYDVNMYEDRITWTPVSQTFLKKSLKQEKSVNKTLVQRGVVYLHEILAVRLKNIRNVKAKTVTTIGFAIFTFCAKGEKVRENMTLFFCYSREICIAWATKLKAAIMARKERPKHLLVLSPDIFSQGDIFNTIVEPRLQTAGIEHHFAEFKKGASITDYVEKILHEQTISQDNQSYDGILVIGKLSFFSELINVIMDYKVKALNGTWHPNIPTIGFVPSSSGNFVGRELHRASDAETAVLHTAYGCVQSIPICSFYDKDGNFLKYGLSASYGFSGGDTTTRSSGKGFSAIQGSLKKSLALTKAIVQRKSYPCEIRYKDSPLPYEPFDEEELFAEEEFAKFSVINKHYIEDDEENKTTTENTSSQLNEKAASDSDSGVWPQRDNWDTVPRRNYLDVMVTSLPQYFNDEGSLELPLSTLLVRETMSRKDLFVGMGSQVSLSSNVSKSKPEVLEKTDVIRGTEIIIKPCNYQASATPLSKWSIDEECMDEKIQELHIKVAEHPVLMYSRGPEQPISIPTKAKILRLDTDDPNIKLDSLA